MILVWLIIIPLVSGLLAGFSPRRWTNLPRMVSLGGLGACLLIVIGLWYQERQAGEAGCSVWLQELNLPWIPGLGVNLHLAMDGLSLLLVVLTHVLGIAAVACSWTEVRERAGLFHTMLLLSLAGITGVFLSVDLFLFYVFWELMLVPVFFLILLWGHEQRYRAAVKFFLFTQLSGLLMLVSILGLYFIHGRQTGVYSFDYVRLLGLPMGDAGRLLMLGFFAAFAVKLPAVPFHTWLPDAHSEAPTAGSVILAGLLLKTGAYGMMRFLVPFFPGEVFGLKWIGMGLAIAGILYGAILAFSQTDLKRLVAYTSVSHMGFVLLGICAWNTRALQGAVMGMVCHGLSTGALFIIAGSLGERLHTRDLSRMGGFWKTAPRMAGFALLFCLASLGLPGLGNFIGEFLVLAGTYPVAPAAAVLAASGLVFAAVYALALIQRVFHGPGPEGDGPPDFSLRETVVAAFLCAAIIWLGMFPRPVLDTAKTALKGIQVMVTGAGAGSGYGHEQ